jgi:hypothetical protein
MSSRNRLAALYEEWRLMSESEGEAIRSLAWQRVNQCQQVKAELRDQILQVMESAGTEQGSPEDIRRQFRPVLEHLIHLETRNSQWLAVERAKLEVERDENSRSQRHLRQVQGAYGQGSPAYR